MHVLVLSLYTILQTGSTDEGILCQFVYTNESRRSTEILLYFIGKMVDSIFNSGQCSVKFRIWNDIFHVIVEDEIQIKTYLSNNTP